MSRCPAKSHILYELGLPVVPTGDRWHVSVGQKVPVSLDRSSLITPGYLRDLRVLVLNELADRLDRDDASEKWVDDALEDEMISAEAVERTLALRFGDKRVVYDPSDPEANKLAVSAGYVVIPSSALSKLAWANVRRFKSALPAGRVTPSPKPYSEDGTPLKLVPEERWTEGMRASAAYAEALGLRLLGRSLRVSFARDIAWPFSATYGPTGELTFNLGRLGHRFFDGDPTRPEMHRLLIHEWGHEHSADHLSSDYHKALCQLGAALAEPALDEPEFSPPLASRPTPRTSSSPPRPSSQWLDLSRRRLDRAGAPRPLFRAQCVATDVATEALELARNRHELL